VILIILLFVSVENTDTRALQTTTEEVRVVTPISTSGVKDKWR
jgi:hypothetical protein